MNWLKKLTSGLSKTSAKVTASLSSLLGRPAIDAASIEEVEDALIAADLGTRGAARLAEGVRRHKFDGEVTAPALAAALADGITEILDPVAMPLDIDPAKRPHVVLLVGVNGSGKTTTAGKLAQQWRQQGKSVMLAAGDTFRAAAIEQLLVWGERTGTEVVAGDQGGDAAASPPRAGVEFLVVGHVPSAAPLSAADARAARRLDGAAQKSGGAPL